MYIILDSNIWISELGLNSSLGAAAKYFFKEQRAIVVLPEVIKLETERHLKAALNKSVSDLKRNHRQLLSVFGKLKELVVPDDEAIEARVASIFGDCQIEINEVPLTLESARSSFLKTIDKIPPSDKDQQFKDGVIWAECLRLLNTADVYLVTADKAFYTDRQYKNGLAKSLAIEAKNSKHTIHIFSALSDLLETIKSEVTLDEKTLAKKFWESSQSSIESILERNAFAVAGDPVVAVQLYVTESPNRLYAEFSISYQCEDLSMDERSDALLRLKGDCTYLVEEKEFEALRNHGEELSFKTKYGENKILRNVVIFAASFIIGHKTIENTIKYKLGG
jgi:PIN domain